METDKTIKELAEICSVNLYLNPEHYNEDEYNAYKRGYENGAMDVLEKVMSILGDTGYFQMLSEEEGFSVACMEEEFLKCFKGDCV